MTTSMEEIKEIKEIEFSTNWNNKLYNKSFTTFRLASRHYQIGALYNIVLCEGVLGVAKCLAIKEMKLAQVNEFIARLDTGYSREQFIELVKKMYKKVRNIEERHFYLVLLAYQYPKQTEL